MISFDGVTKSFGGALALDTVSVTIPGGGIFGLLGANGAGKTTSLRLMLDLLKPTGGVIRIMGESPSRDVNKRIGYLPEERGLYVRMTVLENLLFFASLRGMQKAPARLAARELLARIGIDDMSDRKVKALSKGTAQKVQLAATLIGTPPILLLDEPFSGLDPMSQASLETHLSELAGSGATIIFSTHVMQHAERLCDKILILGAGRILFQGGVAEALAVVPSRPGMVPTLHDAFLHLARQAPVAVAA